MAEVTIVEARLLLNQVEEQLSFYRELMYKKQYEQPSVTTTTKATDLDNKEKPESIIKEVIEEKPAIDLKFEIILKKMDILYAERNKIQVALAAFESFEKLTY